MPSLPPVLNAGIVLVVDGAPTFLLAPKVKSLVDSAFTLIHATCLVQQPPPVLSTAFLTAAAPLGANCTLTIDSGSDAWLRFMVVAPQVQFSRDETCYVGHSCAFAIAVWPSAAFTSYQLELSTSVNSLKSSPLSNMGDGRVSVFIPDSFANRLTQPSVLATIMAGTATATIRFQNIQQLPTFTPAWPFQYFSHPWGECSGFCGSQTQTREVTCRYHSGNDAPMTLCASAALATPPRDQSCRTSACIDSVVYSAWTACNRQCGVGTQIREKCLASPVNGTASCTTESRACMVRHCPTFTSSFTEWTSCSAKCGGGKQAR